MPGGGREGKNRPNGTQGKKENRERQQFHPAHGAKNDSENDTNLGSKK